jgi:glycosyltransferase involved in cell wall biosynthesis
MKLAILGTRGIPANYGGFETFAEELSGRLSKRGHDVTVYCRSHHTSRAQKHHRGARLVVLPTIRHKYLDTVAHAFLSSLHTLTQRFDAVLLCNAANAAFIPIVKLSGAPVAINVDGLEWKRKKWNRLGKSYYQISETIACRVADALVTDAKVVQEYYRERHGKASHFIPYGASVGKSATDDILRQYGLKQNDYLLYVSRFEPENNAHFVLQAFGEVSRDIKLVMVGDAPYARDYVARLREIADERVVFTGYVFGQGYRELMSHARCYIHATEVGGTHPALIEAMGMGNGILVADTPENREVAADGALFFSLAQPEDLSAKMRYVLTAPMELERVAQNARERVRSTYDWELVTDAYESLLQSLSSDASEASESRVHS